MSPNFDPLDPNGRKPVRRSAKQHVPTHRNLQGAHGRHETQRRRYAADCNEASIEIRNALRSY